MSELAPAYGRTSEGRCLLCGEKSTQPLLRAIEHIWSKGMLMINDDSDDEAAAHLAELINMKYERRT